MSPYIDAIVTPVPNANIEAYRETVAITWITYPSRESRDRINAQVMRDPRIGGLDPKTMPFDTKRMFWGGFKTFVSA